jgi:hypothetical protein
MVCYKSRKATPTLVLECYACFTLVVICKKIIFQSNNFKFHLKKICLKILKNRGLHVALCLKYCALTISLDTIFQRYNFIARFLLWLKIERVFRYLRPHGGKLHCKFATDPSKRKPWRKPGNWPTPTTAVSFDGALCRSRCAFFAFFFETLQVCVERKMCITFLSPLRGSPSSTVASRVTPQSYFLL